MKTKSYKQFTVALISLLFLAGCSSSFLDMEQPGVTQVKNYYKTDADATGAIISCYNMMRAMNSSVWTSFWMTKESLSDDIYTGGENSGDRPEYQELNKFTFGSTNGPITNIYKYSYMVIYRANMIVDNFKTPTPYQKIVIAEAKAIRAYMYFELATLYGNVPLVLHELLPTEYAQPNSTSITNADGTITPTGLYTQIEKDLTEAMSDLPLRSQLKASGSDLSRFSKGTAQAFLGKTQLYEKKYSDAAKTLNALIATSEYGLYQLAEINNDYTQLLRKSTEFGKESIFEISYSSDRANDWSNAFGDLWNDPSRTNPANLVWQLCGPRGDQGFNGGTTGVNGGWGFGYPTLDLWKAYKDAGDSVRVQASILTESQVIAKGGTMGKGGNFMWGCPGLVRLKYTTWANETSSAAGAVPDLCYGSNLRIIRYSDVLLMAAEANLLATPADATTALGQINQVRSRVNLLPLASLTLDNIKLERRLELSFEGCRYQDLVRWGDAKNVLKDQGKSVPTGKKIGGVLQFNTNSAAGFVAPKNNMFPIPFNEMSSNPNVKQNPGYN
jgi:starch-binding outer membrane protein, SusD/RagB family